MRHGEESGNKIKGEREKNKKKRNSKAGNKTNDTTRNGGKEDEMTSEKIKRWTDETRPKKKELQGGDEMKRENAKRGKKWI